MTGARGTIKRALAWLPARRSPVGLTVLTYHRVGGGSPDERDLTVDAFCAQLDALAAVDVIGIDDAVTRLEGGSVAPSTVLTFDDGFADVYEHAWPLLSERKMPFTIYLSTSFVGGTMAWPGSTAKMTGPALTWPQLAEMVESGLCTIGNHTHTHVRPEALTTEELDACNAEIDHHLGVHATHFAFCWGRRVVAMEPELRTRFRTAATGQVGRNRPGDDLMRLHRIPVRGSDPIEFFRAKLRGGLAPERAYAAIVAAAKMVGARA